MIELSQWRANIGLWNVIKSFKKGSSHKGRHIIQLKLILSFIIIIIFSIISLLLILTAKFPPSATTDVTSSYCSVASASGALQSTRWVWSVFTSIADSINVTISLSFLLLLLSGDVELNPGPTAKELLRINSADLTGKITSNLYAVTNELYAKGLIPMETKNDILTSTGVSDYTKASKLVSVLEQQLELSSNPNQYLIKVCHALINQQYQSLTDIASYLLRQLGLDRENILPINLPCDVQQYSDMMKERYKNQPIIAIDWPPRVGNDFFGRLALIKAHNEQQHNTAWYMLRGKIDKITSPDDHDEQIAIEDILQFDDLQCPTVVVDGPPGIGKTTLCHKLCNMWANGTLARYDLVLYCPLRNTKIATASTLADLFVYSSPKVINVVKWMSGGEGEKLLIIFDGWDELNTELRHSSLATSIISREQLAKCSVIVTSRSYASFSLLKFDSINKHVQVIGFTEREVAVVVEGTLEDPQLAEKLIADLQIRGDLQSLCYIPLVCSMVIFIYHKLRGKLPTTLTDLYENFILQTIRRHVEKTPGNSIDPTLLDSLSTLPLELNTALKELCHLAYTNLINPQMTFTLYQLQSSLSEAFSKNYLGLITSFTEYDDRIYQFVHLSIQEFLAAWWIVKSGCMKTGDVFKEHFENDHFRMCLRFVAGLTHLKPKENYQQYFSKPIDLQCRREPLSGFVSHHCSLFHPNSKILKYNTDISWHVSEIVETSPHVTFLLYLLYESQSSKLCEIFAQSFINQSFCNERLTKIHDKFDTLCLSFFFNNAKATWNHLHIGNLTKYNWSLVDIDRHNNKFTKVLEAKLESDFDLFNFFKPKPLYTSKLLLKLPFHNIQECVIEPLSGPNDFYIVLCDLLCLPQLKILQLGMNFINTLSESELSDIKMRIEHSIIQELRVRFNGIDEMSQLAVSVIKGVTRNKSIKSFTLEAIKENDVPLHSQTDTPLSPLPNGIIEQLLKDNHTLQSLLLYIPNELLPSSLNVLEVNTPLNALEIRKSKREKIVLSVTENESSTTLYGSLTDNDMQLNTLFTSLLERLNGLHALTVLKNPPHLLLPNLFISHPNLQSLYIHLDTVKSATELFNILQTNTTLKGLRMRIKDKILDSDGCMFTSLHDMLIQNQTLLYLEIGTVFDCSKVIPSSYLSSLTNGLIKNNILQQLRISLPPLSHIDIELLPKLFNVISNKKNLIDIGIDVMYIKDEEDNFMMHFIFCLFSEHLLPAITYMLQSHTTIKQLSLVYPKSELHHFGFVHDFFKTIFTHPSLDYVNISTTQWEFFSDALEDYEEELVALHKDHQPLKPQPMINIEYIPSYV